MVDKNCIATGRNGKNYENTFLCAQQEVPIANYWCIEHICTNKHIIFPFYGFVVSMCSLPLQDARIRDIYSSIWWWMILIFGLYISVKCTFLIFWEHESWWSYSEQYKFQMSRTLLVSDGMKGQSLSIFPFIEQWSKNMKFITILLGLSKTN